MTDSARNNDAIPLTAFDIEAVARVTGLSISQLQRWDRTGFFHPSLADPNRRRPASRIYSRDDVVALKVIAKLREAGVPLAQIKAAPDLLGPGETGGRHVRALYVVGNRFFLSRDEALEAASHHGQKIEPTVIDMASVLTEVDEAIERLEERHPEEIGRVIRRRGTMRGVPIIAGTRIPTETINWFHSHGYSLSWILENFPRLTAMDVQAAVEFERAQTAVPPDAVVAHR